MKIKSLEIIGFKSFVDKVSLDFQQDITSIVGPNGCGKSNIVDAIRWGMGEQSAKNLRGKQMEDIIFGGSETRKPLGMAEVSLVFSTDDGKVPAKYLNFNEIQITRRLYRDGESEYFINKTPCRLMDITELFMDTGVGARAYSIIEQGKIGVILHSKPEDRRFLIEEAAGVTKFKARKQVALKKIEYTRQNLLRLNDILSEIRRQLNSLQRQAKKAEKYREYREEIREIEQFFAVRSYLALDEEKGTLERTVRERSARVDELALLRHTREVQIEERRVSLVDLEANVARAQEKVFGLKDELQKLENGVVLRKNELESLDRHRVRVGDELKAMEAQITDAERELEAQNAQQVAVVNEIAEADDILADREEALDEMLRVEGTVTRDLEERRRSLFSVLSEIAQAANASRTSSRRLEALLEKVERNNRENIVLLEKMQLAGQSVEQLEGRVRELAVQKASAAELLRGAEEKNTGLKARLAETERALQAKSAQLHTTASRLHSLQELQAAFEGYGNAVRSLLLSDGFRGRFSGVLADLLETTEEYETALEAFLGDKLQYLVCRDSVDAIEAISHLKETSAGRSSFIIGNIFSHASEQVPASAVPLLEKVTVVETHRDSVEPLLRGVYLAGDLAAAVDLSRAYSHCHFVTPEGDIVTAGGIVTGGSPEAAGTGLVHKKREIRELTAAEETLRGVVTTLQEDRDNLREEVSVTENEVAVLRRDIHAGDIALLTAEKDLQRAREERQRLDERLAVRKMEDDQLDEEKELLETEIRQTEEAVDAKESLKADLEKSVRELEARLAEHKEVIGEARNLVTSMKVRAGSLKEKREGTARAITRLQELLAGLRSRLQQTEGALQNEDGRREALIDAIAEGDAAVRKMVVEVKRAEETFGGARQAYEEASVVMREGEADLRTLANEHEGLREQVAELSVRLSECTLRLGHIEESLFERCRIYLADIVPRFRDVEWSEEEKVGRQRELQALVDEMGEVNLMAIDEYRELEERFNFLSSQKSDLEESMHSLQQAIQKINRTTRKRFIETFHRVNEKFQEIFPRLFCGGRAELRLTDEQDLLETGIDIVVQPPGKKLQNVTLLSGGEKALTALSLIFSIFLIKPSPFCLLDEVDAPLDDANIGRFNDMVREMSRVSQFIMITHNKGTMAVADTLYGVTMEQPGVSKIVSVKLS